MPLTTQHRRLILVLGIAIAIGPMSIDMYLPALPTLAKELAASQGEAQFTLSAYFAGLVLGQLLYGPLIDRYGRKRPLYAGLALYILASLGCALAWRIEALMSFRALQALGGGSAIVVSRAVVRDLFEPKAAAKVFALLMLVMGLAPILAPLLGGWILVGFGWRWIFAALMLFAMGTLLATWRMLPETGKPRGGPRGGYGSVFSKRIFLSNALGGALAQAGMFAYIAAAPFVFIELFKVPAEHFGWLFGANAFGLIAATQLNGRLLDHFTLEQVLRGALLTHAVAGLALLAVVLIGRGGLPAILVPLFLCIASMGLVFPNSTALAMAPFENNAGTAAAALGMVQYGAAALSAAVAGSWHDGTALPMAAVLACCALGANVMLRVLAPKSA
ncbi:MAG TPA: multidrug effflux MFS transporter [Solimonas sp.]